MTALSQMHDQNEDQGTGSKLAPEDTGLLTIDLAALRRNYRALNAVTGKSECASVVKADAYGLGADAVVPALIEEGCKTFFVATVDEARQVRALAQDKIIYLLNGISPGTAQSIADIDARPVLSSMDEIEEWAKFCTETDTKRPAAIHIDTGMNRLGLTADEVSGLSHQPEVLERFDLCHVMSHLACADDPACKRNAEQLERFEALRAKLPPCPSSIANSAGIIIGKAYHLDLVRPGIALYGARPLSKGINPLKPVVRLQARVLQIRQAEEGQTVSYGAERVLNRQTRIATVALGYADGFFRSLGQSDSTPAAALYFGDHPAPLLGRVSMDLVCVDVTDVPEDLVERGTLADVIGPHMTVDDLARRAHTISYEILTALGRRFKRQYIRP